jgi:hypothetical protein
MDLANMAGKCRACNALVNLRDYLPESVQPVRPVAPRQRLQVPRPPGFVVDDSGMALTITRRWFSCAFIFLAFFCVAWDSFLVFWYSMAFAMNAPWIFKVFPVIHLAVGIGLTYFTLAGFLNRTTITVDGEALSIHHGPLPWWGNCRLPVDQLEQVYCQQQTNRGRNGVSYSYTVNAVMKEGSKRTLVSGLTEQDHALYIEQQLERYLGIQDRPVPGEMPR